MTHIIFLNVEEELTLRELTQGAELFLCLPRVCGGQGSLGERHKTLQRRGSRTSIPFPLDRVLELTVLETRVQDFFDKVGRLSLNV